MAITVTPTGTTLQVSTDSGFTTIVNTNDSGTYRTSQSFVRDDLPYGVDLYARVKHTSAEAGESAWSTVVKFQIAIPKYIAGICLDLTTTAGSSFRIDALGNKLASFDQTTHPTYAGTSIVTLDTSRGDPVYMLKIPKFYIKTAASGPVGSDASGKKCWWISNIATDGFRPHPAFKRSTSKDSSGKYVINDYIYISQYGGHSATVGGKTCIGSCKGKSQQASIDTPTARTYCTNRNNASAGQTGWRMLDCYDISVIQMLASIAWGDFHSQNHGDNSAGTSCPVTGSTGAKFTFHDNVTYEDAWRCYWYQDDLITHVNGIVSLKSPMDLTSSVAFGSSDSSRRQMSTSSGTWVRDVCDCPITIGDDTHDLMEFFLPKTTTSSESTAPFHDFYWYYEDGTEKVFYQSADWWVGTYAGLWCVNVGNPASFSNDCIASRLAKN